MKKETEHKELFRTLKLEPKATIDILFAKETYNIDQVFSSTLTVKLDRPPPSLSGHFHLGQEAIVPKIIENSSDCLVTFDSDTLPVPGQQITQTVPLTQPAEIFAELERLWLPDWQGHDDLPEEAWRRILAFNRHFLPTLQLNAPPITVDDVTTLLRSGGGHRTKGPDCWSRADILSLPSLFAKDMVHLFSAVEGGGQWPTQLIHGHVTSLEKVANAQYANEFRPIVLYSLWYRIWGSLRSRHLLLQLEHFANFPAYGFLRGRHCQPLTYQVMCLVEKSLTEGTLACGVVADIVKCFNNLPRQPLYALATQLGIPQGVLHSWRDFLQRMKRSFRVHQQHSDSHVSSVGLPEGDSMSCLGMCLASFSFHHYMKFFCPDLSTLSYVDNVEVYGAHAGKLVAGHVAMETWMEMMRLSLDSKKTAFWASTSETRALLRAQGFQVVESCTDLGAPTSYGAKHLNRQMQLRIESLQPYWPKLRALKASTWHKLLAIRQALLPRALHGCSHIYIGQQWFKKLRTQIMRSMRCGRAGASPILRLNFIFPIDVDPGFYDAHISFRDFHRQLGASVDLRVWWKTFRLQLDKKTHGPFGKIIQLLATLGRHIDADGIFVPWAGISLHFWQLDFDVVRMHLEYCWRQSIIMQIDHRKDYAGLHGIDFAASFTTPPELDRSQSALLACSVHPGWDFPLGYYQEQI